MTTCGRAGGFGKESCRWGRWGLVPPVARGGRPADPPDLRGRGSPRGPRVRRDLREAPRRAARVPARLAARGRGGRAAAGRAGGALPPPRRRARLRLPRVPEGV